jgi:hypothetical protein
MTSYWLRLARKTEWGSLLSLVSPSFFDVLPARALFSQGRDLLKNLHAKSSAAARQRTSRALEAAGRPVSILAALPGKALSEADGLAAPERTLVGELVLELYFRPLLGTGESLLDLRAERLALDDDGPCGLGPAWVRWDADFLLEWRLIAASTARSPRSSRKARDVGPEPAEALLRKHFGEGDQTAVRFEVAHFQKSFHAVHRVPEARRAALNFLPLGSRSPRSTPLERLTSRSTRAVRTLGRGKEESQGGREDHRRRGRDNWAGPPRRPRVRSRVQRERHIIALAPERRADPATPMSRGFCDLLSPLVRSGRCRGRDTAVPRPLDASGVPRRAASRTST